MLGFCVETVLSRNILHRTGNIIVKNKLNRSAIEAAIRKKKRCYLWDSTLKGFYAEVQVTPNGSVSCSYRIRHTHKKKKQVITIGPYTLISLEEARAKAQETLAQLRLNPAAVTDSKMTLAELVSEKYLPHIQVTKKAWKSDQYLLNGHILPALGHKRLTDITSDDIATLQQDLLFKKYQPGTNNRVIILIKTILNRCIRVWKIPGLTSNPGSAVKQLKLNNHRQTFLTPPEIERLLAECQKNAAQSPYLPYIVALLALTGVRRSNGLNARWEEFDTEKNIWTIPMTKSGKPQAIQLSPEVLQLLEALPSQGQSEWLFPNPKTGKPYSAIWGAWNTARKKAGFPHVRIHDLRHTFASLLINSGHNLYVVQKALGHHSPVVTMRYAHLADQTLKDANNAVGSLVKSGIDQLLR
jgi:integrase